MARGSFWVRVSMLWSMGELVRTSGGLRLPDFVGIGGQRCGSTTLWHWLRGDDRLFLPERKELHYFSDRDGEYRPDLENYGANFEGASDSAVVGEFTPNYLTSAGACRRIRKHLPDAKLILLLRDPVERAISHYNFRVIGGRESRSISRAMYADMKRCQELDEVVDRHHAYCQMSMYARGYERYVKAFGRDQILVLYIDELKSASMDVRERLGVFLGLGSGLRASQQVDRVANKSATHPRSRVVQVIAKSTLRGSREQTGLAARARCSVARRALALNSGRGTFRVPDTLRTELRSFFQSDSLRLQELLGESLAWVEV
jgi:Sulfotransferase domain